MRPLIFLDIDGVLNPGVTHDARGARLVLSPERVGLVRELAAVARIVWASTVDSALTLQLTEQIDLPADTQRVRFANDLPVHPDFPGTTPKLQSIARWLDRLDTNERPSAIVWIDDIQRADARAWAARQPVATLLLQPNADRGLLEQHVAEARAFVGDLR